MNLTEIKKELYKTNPDARMTHVNKGNAFYYADLKDERVYFIIPVSDMGDTSFNVRMDSKYLIRWIAI